MTVGRSIELRERRREKWASNSSRALIAGVDSVECGRDLAGHYLLQVHGVQRAVRQPLRSPAPALESCHSDSAFR